MSWGTGSETLVFLKWKRGSEAVPVAADLCMPQMCGSPVCHEVFKCNGACCPPHLLSTPSEGYILWRGGRHCPCHNSCSTDTPASKMSKLKVFLTPHPGLHAGLILMPLTLPCERGGKFWVLATFSPNVYSWGEMLRAPHVGDLDFNQNHSRFHKGKARSWLVGDVGPCVWQQEREGMSQAVF